MVCYRQNIRRQRPPVSHLLGCLNKGSRLSSRRAGRLNPAGRSQPHDSPTNALWDDFFDPPSGDLGERAGRLSAVLSAERRACPAADLFDAKASLEIDGDPGITVLTRDPRLHMIELAQVPTMLKRFATLKPHL